MLSTQIQFTKEEKEVHMLLSSLIVKASLEAFRHSAHKYRSKPLEEIPFEPTETYKRLIRLQQDFNQGVLSCPDAKRIAARYQYL